MDVETGRQTLVHEHPSVDVEAAVVSEVTGKLLYAAAFPDYQDVRFFESRLPRAFDSIRAGGKVGFWLRSSDLARAAGKIAPRPRCCWWTRDYWSYSSAVQFLANRGYAVLQVNYRGSYGYGRRFREAAVGEFAGKMHDDLIDAVDWAVRRGVADRRRVGIVGWSYGGYATLVGMTFTPGVFACGVDIVGSSSLVSLLETRHTYWTWHALRPYWHKYAGDPTRPEDRRRMEAKSPLFRAHRAQGPLLIVHGANDPNVKRQESDQMVEALRRAGKDVEYVVFADEGTGASTGATTSSSSRRSSGSWPAISAGGATEGVERKGAVEARAARAVPRCQRNPATRREGTTARPAGGSAART